MDLDLGEVADQLRLVVLRDPAGHALAERHADLVELHAHEPDRGARDEHLAVVVEQQQHRALGADGVRDDPQHLGEQVVEPQVDQPGGGDRLEVVDPVRGRAQLLALAHELAVRDDQLVVELEHLLDEMHLLPHRRLGDEQDRVAETPQPHPAVDRDLGIGAREGEHRARPVGLGGGEPAREGVALGGLDQRLEAGPRDPLAGQPLQRGVGFEHGAVGRQRGGQHRGALPGVALDLLADHGEAGKRSRTARTAASASSA